MEYKIKQLNVSDIKPDKNQPRKTFDFEKLKESSETYKTQGTISPIEIDENNIIITGELRWRACKLAGLKIIPCKILKGLTPEQKLERQLVENFNRQDMRLVDSIDAVKKYMKSIAKGSAIGSNADKFIGETATRLGISRDWLSQNLKLDREAPEELKKAVKEEKISVSQATEIMKLPDKEEREELTKEILEEAEVPEYRKIRERVKDIKEKKEMKKAIEEIKKTKDYSIKITRTEEQLADLKEKISDEIHRIGKLMFYIGQIRRTKLYLEKPKAKESFFKFIDGSIERVEKWVKDLKNLRDNLEFEIIKE
ncbi:MAG TPA: ParB/RepB/Spo0J family partition protein [Candidatus Lokiarchaeia archaeon]